MNVCPECGQTFQQGGFCTQDGTALLSGSGDPLLGALLGPYRVAGVIGVGGMGRVYKGVNPTIRSRVAIKVLSHDCADQPDLVERFFAEARAVNFIRHENIVNVLDLARLADGRPYIVMEFLDGSSLAGLLSQHPRLPLGTLARWTMEVLAGLGAAHAKGVVHRDLKPDNIFITRHGRAKILDFGVAKLALEPRDGTSRTRAGSLIGTPHYMSPEQAQSLPADARADLYAVGVILYEASTGRRPFDGDSVFEILRSQVEDEPPPPRRFAPEMPPAYERVIVRAMAKDPAQRWQTADELGHALSDAAASLPPGAWAAVGAPSRPDLLVVPPTRTPDHGHPTGRPGARTALLVTAGLLLAGAATAAIIASRPRGEEGEQVRHDEDQSVRSEGQAVGDGTVDGAGAFDAAPATASMPSGTADASVAARADRAPEQPEATPAEAGERHDEVATGQEPGIGPGGAGGAGPRERKGGRKGKADPARPAADRAGTDGGDAEARAGGPADRPDVEDGAVSGDTKEGEGAGDSKALRQESGPRGVGAWDVSGYLPTALARARRKFPDAVLVRIDADGVYPSGKADLTLDDGFSVLYRFMSPSRARRPADLPQGVEHKPTCMFYVSIDRKSVTAYPLPGWSCEKERPIPMPRCSARQIWKRAAADGAPTKNAVGSLSYRFNMNGDVTWWFSIGKDHQHTYDDDC